MNSGQGNVRNGIVGGVGRNSEALEAWIVVPSHCLQVISLLSHGRISSQVESRDVREAIDDQSDSPLVHTERKGPGECALQAVLWHLSFTTTSLNAVRLLSMLRQFQEDAANADQVSHALVGGEDTEQVRGGH
jgi:hypothetical protein